MLVVVGCGPMVAGGDAGGDAGNDEGAATSTGAGEDSRGDDPFVTSVTMTTSDEDDTGDVEPPPGECGAPGTCAGDCATWKVEYEGPADRADQLAAIAVAPDGTIVAAGMRDWVQDVGAGDPVVVAYDVAGNQLWEAMPRGTDDGVQDAAYAVAVTQDGTVAVSGGSWTPSGDLGAWYAVLDATGAVVRVMDLGEYADATTMLWLADGSLVMGGSRPSDDGSSRAGFVHRYEPSGIVIAQWENIGVGLPEGIVLGAVATSPTTLALTGSSDATNDVWLASLDLDAGPQWIVTHDGDPDTSQWGSDLAVLPDGDLLVVGTEHDADYNGLSWAGRFGPDGSERWTRKYPGTGCCANGLDRVEVSDDGRVFVLGVRGGNGLLMKVQELDCDGEIVWEWNNEDADWNGSAFSGGLAWSAEAGLVASAGIYPSGSNNQHGFVARFPM